VNSLENHQLKLQMVELVINLISRIDSIVALFGSNCIHEATDRLIFLAEDISVLAQSVAVIQETNSNLDLDELNEKLTVVVQQIENGDYLYVSDVLSFELKPLFQHWSELLQDA
jgi:hypothetical protein